jgi:hypothetical protein
MEGATEVNRYKCCVILCAIICATVIACAALASGQDGYTVKTALGIIVLCLSAVGVQHIGTNLKRSGIARKAARSIMAEQEKK